ncbi:class 3 adenylate cyclase [Catenulispora sp. EB89]|uniref:hypothetical protein n=1 Tax=Catenulispora sp. EB89 TaxID=3156257 RepID=UPI0035125100
MSTEEALHHLVVVYDIQGSAGLTNPEKIVARQTLDDCCTAALETAAIPAGQVRVKDLGDGAMLQFGAEIAKSRVLGSWLGAFHNRLRRVYEQAERPVQVRLAAHAGELHPSLNEYTGVALDFTARLADAPAAKRVLSATPSAPLAVIVSEVVYDQVVRHRGGGLEPASFSRIRLQVKETDTTAWLHLPGWARVPMSQHTETAPGDMPSPRTGADRVGDDVGQQNITVSGGNVGVIGEATVHGPFTVGGSGNSR